MKISVFGLGYVGVVSAACFSRDGHEVVGVDVSAEKVDMVARGLSPIIEPRVDELLAAAVAKGMLTATTDAEEAVARTEVSLVSVGTPPGPEGAVDLTFVDRVIEDIGHALLRSQRSDHVVVVRSTVPPGTARRSAARLREIAPDRRVSVAMNPEFLREGSAVADYDSPPYTIIGTEDPAAEAAVRELYSRVDASILVVKPEVAELAKYVANAWHATKISFANEIGRIAKAFEIDGREVMSIMAQDTKLNVSPAYMRPGFAFGGSCLPKDLSSLIAAAGERRVPLELLPAVRRANEVHIEVALRLAIDSGATRIAVLGLAFKPGTDDLRESAAVVLVKRLIGEGKEVKVYDRDVRQAKLVGTNLDYLRRNIPHVEGLLQASATEALADAELAIVTHSTPELRDAIAGAPGQLKVLDLAGLFDVPPEGAEYAGIAW